MPRGKARASETSIENAQSGRSSMRRLSSFASLHQFLPFSRSRRSNTHEDSVTSDISSISTTSIAPQNETNAELVLEEVSGNTRPAPPHAYGGFLRKNNYASLPEPTGGLPRSKTFSNLPLPVKSRKHQSHTPAVSLTENPILSSSALRVPTPPESTRRYMPFMPKNTTRFGLGSKLPRSDTEPLLVDKSKQKVSLTQMLKENMPIEPPKQANPADLFHKPLTNDASSKQEEKRLPRLPSSPEGLSKSSPAFKSKANRRISELTGIDEPRGRTRFAQRWNSQPNLYSTPRRQGTPPTSALPSFSDQLTRSLIGAAPFTPAPLDRLDESEGIEQVTSRSNTVWEARPTAYWAGRLSTLLDIAKNDEIAGYFAEIGDSFPPRRESDAVYHKASASPRSRRALESLYAECMTPSARESFVAFQMQYAALMDEPELARPIGGPKLTLKSHHALNSSNTVTPPSSKRSVSFVNRLLGRGK